MEEVFGEYFVDLKHFINCFMEMIMTIYLSKKSILLVSRVPQTVFPRPVLSGLGQDFSVDTFLLSVVRLGTDIKG